MTPLISCQSIGKSYGSRDLFQELSVTLFPGDSVGLVGPNGAGKSTLLKLLAGVDTPDSGEIVRTRGLRVGYVPQDVEAVEGSVEDVVSGAVWESDHLDEYARHGRVRKMLGELGFSEPSQPAQELSGGWKRRLTIATALVNDPDVVLFDEPTNHLDLDSILWLETFLQRARVAFVVTSHDRVFLDGVSTKMWELSHRYPGGLFSVDGGYTEFLERRATFLEGQRNREQGLRSKMRREEQWLQQTPKARTTKSRSRIQEAARLKHELARVKLRNIESKARLDFAATGRQTKKLVTAKSLSKAFEGKTLFSDVDVTLNRGDRLGIVGDNGSGKSTLLKILSGELDSDTGTVKFADDLQIFLFDQHRESLDLELPLRRGLAPMGDTVNYQGRSIHVNGWCERFLFNKDRLDLPMKQLSGGERARVVIARLMIKPADILLLDEPTNDIDIDTLEVLEDSLDEFPGAVVLISHDRAMMDRVADKLLAITDDGETKTFNDSEQWLQWRHQQRRKQKQQAQGSKSQATTKPRQGLSYREQQELAGVEQLIIELEAKVQKLAKHTEDPDVVSDGRELQRVCDELGEAQKQLDAAFSRWQDLEDRK